MKCRNFKITWEPSFPYACLIFGVKCRGHLPSTEVFLSNGKHCFAFMSRDMPGADSSDSEDSR